MDDGKQSTPSQLPVGQVADLGARKKLHWHGAKGRAQVQAGRFGELGNVQRKLGTFGLITFILSSGGCPMR